MKNDPGSPSGRLAGTWKLVSVQVEMADTGERLDLYGPNPVGRLILTEDGRMMAVMTSGNRTPGKDETEVTAWFRTMMAYTGEYRLAGGDSFVTKVDIAWHPGWNGEQTRYFRRDGDVLSIRTAEQTHPAHPGRTMFGLVEWRRER